MDDVNSNQLVQTDTRPNILASWRKSISVVLTTRNGKKQLALTFYDRTQGVWVKASFFRTAADYDEFVNELVDAGDKIEADNLMPEDPDQGWQNH